MNCIHYPLKFGCACGIRFHNEYTIVASLTMKTDDIQLHDRHTVYIVQCVLLHSLAAVSLNKLNYVLNSEQHYY